MRNVTEIQQRLIDLGFLSPGGADGVFGTVTLMALNRFLATKGRAPVLRPPSMADLNALLFPEDQPPEVRRSNPITDYLTGLAIKAVLNNALKGLPMLKVLAGYKTYVAGAAMLLTGITNFIGTDLPGSEGFSPLQWVFGGIIVIAGRSALNTLIMQAAALFGVDATKLPKIGE